MHEPYETYNFQLSHSSQLIAHSLTKHPGRGEATLSPARAQTAINFLVLMDIASA